MRADWEPAKSTWTEWSMTRSTGTRGSTMDGSAPALAAALRMAARSTTSGTPVKSWRTTRPTVNGTSYEPGDFAFQLARFLTSCSVIFLPSQLRRRDSRTMRMEMGRREMLGKPWAWSAGSEW